MNGLSNIDLKYNDAFHAYFNGDKMINKLELRSFLDNISSLEMLDQAVTGAFWVAPSAKQAEFLSFLNRETVIELLKNGLNGFSRQASAALKLLKEAYPELINILREDIFAAALSDSLKICKEAGMLLLQEEPDYINQRPWFLKRLASIAEAPEPVAERLSLIVLLCKEANSFNFLQLEHYPDKDEVVAEFISQEHYLPLALYLRSALTRWEPVAGDPAHLAWLIKVYTEMKNSSEHNEGELTLKGQQKNISIHSKFVLEAALYETAVAGADAIIRCINGPGGEHLWNKFSEYMSDKDLAEELLLSLSRDPRALAILAEDMLLDTSGFNLLPTAVIKVLSHGVLASQHCLKEILKLSISTALLNQETSKLFMEKIDKDKNNLYPYAKDLFDKLVSVTN
ncbi:hypothetical protein Dtox_1245 [Desulfofarcimen acetoxidans DSM 771]|uniref:Uncharacterized protein n=1 Tax=Desulfofarcimen acetoxidans (strain ATCC 49208 / DSM 771 / KCTC 5769 / VKM B-1644 / 5575) TaxID=485916 RepID=C8W5E5_DESAS|nr:hypothetical protein [Desulfofarcimen acetoxidans]ACV62127.1 hypothetical protein Dtox_1245 [Desulfofarcimen acetoxidans DSM 771]